MLATPMYRCAAPSRMILFFVKSCPVLVINKALLTAIVPVPNLAWVCFGGFTTIGTSKPDFHDWQTFQEETPAT